MYLLYSLLFSVGAVLAAPHYLWRHRKRIRSLGWRERFGLLPNSFQESQRGAIWIHGVSVGETLAVVGLIRELQRLYPERKIFLSHVTPAGREAGENRLTGLTGRFYLPLDWRWSVRRAFERIRPALLLIAETELWPNLLRVAKEQGACVVLVNARLSDRSFRRYRMIRPFIRRVLGNVDCVCARMTADAERFTLLGARPERVVVTGNLKFDAKPPPLGELPSRLKLTLNAAGRGPIIVAGSTMPGEETLVLQAWEQIRRRHPRAALIIAPRHPARFDEVARLMADNGRTFGRRTGFVPSKDGLRSQLASAEVFLLDTIGELAGIFELADVVFMGGSLVPTGGHNLLEPAFWGKPILFGPHMRNFPDMADLFLQAGAAIQVRDFNDLAAKSLQLLQDEAKRRDLGEKARQVLKRESGATQRTVEHIRELLESDVAGRGGV